MGFRALFFRVTGLPRSVSIARTVEAAVDTWCSVAALSIAAALGHTGPVHTLMAAAGHTPERPTVFMQGVSPCTVCSSVPLKLVTTLVC